MIVACIFFVGGGFAGFLGATFFFDTRGARSETGNVIKFKKDKIDKSDLENTKINV